MFGYTLPLKLTAGQRSDFQLLIDADSDFIIEKVYSNETGPFRLMILDTTTSYQWFSDRIRMENFFGTAEYPNELPTPIEVKRGTQLHFDVEDLSGAPNDVELVFEGYRVAEAITLGKKRYFAYVKNFTIPGNDRAQDTLQTNSDTDFLVNRFIAYRSKDYVNKLKMSLSSLAARQMYSQFTTIENIFGSVLRPNNLVHPVKLEKNSIVKYEIQNTDPAAQTLQLVFDGVKIWS
jgi:hypothetical protein